MQDNKHTVKIFVLVSIMCILIVGYYAYLSDRNVKQKQNTKLSEQQELLLCDLKKDYPHSPRDVVKLYSRMMKVVYNERLEGDKLEKMVGQMRKLYDVRFAEDSNNTKENQIAGIKEEISQYEGEDKITNYTLSESSQVEYKTVNGEKCAYVEAVYTLRKNNKYSKIPQLYVLVQDENKNWKILGWSQAEEDNTANE